MIFLSLLTIFYSTFDIYVYLIPFAYARLKTTIGAGSWLRQGKLIQHYLDVGIVFLILIMHLVGDILLVIPVGAVGELRIDHQDVLVGLYRTVTEEGETAFYHLIGSIGFGYERHGYLLIRELVETASHPPAIPDTLALIAFTPLMFSTFLISTVHCLTLGSGFILMTVFSPAGFTTMRSA